MTLFPPNLAAEEALAAVGAVLRSIQIIPQIVKSYRTKSTHGLSSTFMLVWACTQLALGPYTIVQQLAIPLQIQPQAFAFFSAVSWGQCLYYEKEWSRLKSALSFVALLTVLAGAQVGSVFGLRAGREAGTETPVMVFGYLTWLRTFLSAPPQFYKIYKLREVVGTSYLFMGVDILGAIFSILSLLFRPKLDTPAIVTFALVVVQNGLVILLALILNPMARKRRIAEGIEPDYASQRSLRSRRGSRATRMSIASSMTMVNPSARVSRVDLEKGRLDISRTNTIVSPEDPKRTPSSADVKALGEAPLQPLTRGPTTIGFDDLPSGQTSRASSGPPTPFERSRNATAVDLTALREEKGEDKLESGDKP